MSPAKATRPGFRHSLTVGEGDEKPSASAINLFHPIYHTYATPIRSRIDVDRTWPSKLDEVDAEDLIDTFSEPPQFAERMSPVAIQLGDQYIQGYNRTEVRLKVLHRALDLFSMIGRFMESTLRQDSGGTRIPFTSVSLDPDTIHRLVEMDYESGESAYQQLMNLYSEGTLTPALTLPFQSLPARMSDTEFRLSVRIGLTFYERIIRRYAEFLRRNGEEGLMVLPFWMPETAYQKRLVAIICEEFDSFCKKCRFGHAHLVFLLDSHQADYRENDVLMKSWNLLGRPAENGDGAKRPRKTRRTKGGATTDLHAAAADASVVFRDRTFSDWVVYANPSVKKLLDRTIAKVDSDLNGEGIHYGWAHFEDLEALSITPKSVTNFKQKLVKLVELGYVPLSPDFYVRGKLRGQLGYASIEPQKVELHEDSAGASWDAESVSFNRWEGLKDTRNGEKTAADHRKITRNTADGTAEVEAPQGWKIGWNLVREKCVRTVVGDLETCTGGMAGVLADFAGKQPPKKRAENVHEFMVQYTYVYWREHFIQHDLSEADINIHEMANEYLRAGMKSRLSEKDAAVASAAAQAIYFAFDSGRYTGTRYEHMDQRAFYQNVSMLALAICNAAYVYTWLGQPRKAREMVDLLKTELIGFEDAFKRYDLGSFGVRKKHWEMALASEVEDSADNVVRRAARRVGACHLRPLGFTRDFSRDDEIHSTNVGHLWNEEMNSLNWKYENPYFCGVRSV